MKCIILLLLLLFSTTATAANTYDLSCENVSRVLIVRSEDSFLGLHTPQGHMYSVSFRLKPDAADRFQPILEASRKLIVHSDDLGGYSRRGLVVTSNGQPLRNDVPEIWAHSGAYVNTFILREEDAFATARSVCPTAPIELIIPPRMSSPGQE